MVIRISHPTAVKAKLFRGFSDMSRLSLIEALRAGPLTVTALVERTGLTQSNVSNHLACLRDCGLVIASARGRYAERRCASGSLDRTGDDPVDGH